MGAIQGRNLEGVTDTYRDLTGLLHGMRPRDFLVEVFCLLCRVAGIARICAVADEYRAQRSPYFGRQPRELPQNYDEVWRDRGGTPTSPEFYSLPVGGNRRELAEIPSKKRSMYRKRYDLLDRIEASLREVFQR